MKRVFCRAIIPLLLCLIFLSFESVYAIFEFSDLPVDAIDSGMYFDIDLFDYSPSEVLPGGENVTASLGENHLKLINNLLNQKDYGLNATKKPIIHELLQNPHDMVYSDQHVTSGHLKFLMPSFSSETEALYFVIMMTSETEYVAYTLLDADRNLPLGTEVLTYKTLLKNKDGKWEATTSYVGYAKVNDPDDESIHRAIDVTTWRPE